MTTCAIATPGEYDECERLLIRLLDKSMKTLIPTPALERQARTFVPGFPDTIVARAHDGHRIVAAGLIRTDLGPIQQLVDQGWGPARAVQPFAEWRALTQLAVERDHRGQGIGRQLVELLESQASRGGARGVWGFAEDHDGVPSRPFYRRCGYTVLEEGAPMPPFRGVDMRSPRERVGGYFYKRIC